VAESPLVTLARVLGGVVLMQGNLGHQVLGQLLVMNSNEVAMAAATVVLAGTTGQRSAVGQIALRTVAPALAVRVLLNKQEQRIERREIRLADRERAIEKRRSSLRWKNRQLHAELERLSEKLRACESAASPATISPPDPPGVEAFAFRRSVSPFVGPPPARVRTFALFGPPSVSAEAASSTAATGEAPTSPPSAAPPAAQPEAEPPTLPAVPPLPAPPLLRAAPPPPGPRARKTAPAGGSRKTAPAPEPAKTPSSRKPEAKKTPPARQPEAKKTLPSRKPPVRKKPSPRRGKRGR